MTPALSRDTGYSPISTVNEKLVSIWKTVLGQSTVCDSDNFFALGGTPLLAVKLCDEISRWCGRELPPLVICHAPTLASLAAVLEQQLLPRFSPLAPLKSGEEGSPVFLAHGLCGSVLEFFETVKHVETRHAIYGLQAIADNGADREFERIEEVAQFYADAMQQRQPHGPYRLVGYSLGGLTALEIAQQLLARGEKIASLILLDAYPHESAIRPGQRARLLAQLVRHHSSIIRGLRAGSALSYLLSSTERLQHAPRGEAESFIRKPYREALKLAGDKAYRALARYRPRPYHGKVRFVKAAQASVFPVDPAAVWAPWVQDLEVETAPGDHYRMISQHGAQVGLLLSRYLDEAG